MNTFKPFVRATIITASVLAIAVMGSLFTSIGLEEWYGTLTLPTFAPPGQVIGLVWTVLFVLLGVSAFIAWERVPKMWARKVALLYVLNGVLNVSWSLVFFGAQRIDVAVLVAAALALSVLGLIIANVRYSTLAAALLIPYFLWVSFASYLTYQILLLNSASNESVTSFEECAAAGYPIMESYPEQCRAQGKTFVRVIHEGALITGYQLAVGETVAVDQKLSVTLLRVDDSRCAPGIVCIWAGELSPLIRAEVRDASEEIRLSTETAREKSWQGYVFTLRDATEDSASITVERE